MISHARIATILRCDAALCFACGLPGLIAPAWLAGFLLPQQETVLGMPTATVLWELGILLVAYAGLLLLAAIKPGLDRPVLLVSAVADAGWVLGTVALVAAFPASFSSWGIVALAVVALDTALIGLWKLRVLRGGATPLAA
ncbi:hypothetical protein [Ferrovibrio terrae]|uniref:hypothetical protein n=1 Tax=Ferrovibrio terrae TaxID=2594003 RepID=UPI003137A490